MTDKLIRALIAAGVTLEMMPEVMAAAEAHAQAQVDACYAAEEARRETQRAKWRERKDRQRCHDRLRAEEMSPNVPVTSRDIAGHSVTLRDNPLKEIPPGPPKENTPLSVVSAKASTTGAEAAPPDPEKELFGRGKAVLGKTAGGLIAELLRAKGGSIPLARAAIEQASTKQNPAEYIGAIVSGRIGKAPPKLPDGAIVNADGTWSRYAL